MSRFQPRFMLALLGAALAAGIARPVDAGTDRVLVVINQNSAASREIGSFYAQKRGLPAANVFKVHVPDSETISLADYHGKIRKPLLNHIRARKLTSVDFIVTTKGVPLKDNRGYSIDSMLTMLEQGTTERRGNPVYGKFGGFDSQKYSMYLVTRLTGYTVADAKRLVTNALLSNGKRGTFLLDIDPYQDKRDGYRDVNQDIRAAALRLMALNIPYKLDGSDTFVGGQKNLMGYYSWGSNDSHFRKDAYLSNRFLPGAIGETVVSTSGRTFKPTSGGQSLIADLVKNGITGVKGYVSEPYSVSMARAALLFDRYVGGYNLAESFYMASPFICWKDVVVGDPLAAPYKKK